MPDVILPVLNEVTALPWVLSRMPEGYRPIVVDNGSVDGSAQCAAGLGASVIEEPVRGFGSACWAGLVASTDAVVCFMDCDGSLDPMDLPVVAAPVLCGTSDLAAGQPRPRL
jgi:glycosyltransferase involved in cell wall biosynthesis